MENTQEIKTEIPQPLEIVEPKLVSEVSYELEDLLSMLSATDFYSMDQIQYVYYKLRGEEEEAQYFLNILTNQQMAVQKKLNRMKLEINAAEVKVEIPKIRGKKSL